MNDPTLFVSYAQHGEDVILWRALGDRGPGFYIDVGAFHPTDDSVTQALYEHGWRGINIEPQSDRLAAFERERPKDTNLCLAIGDQDGTATLTIPRNPGWASTATLPLEGDDAEGTIAVDVPARRLDTLLAELGVDRIDVLNIDVEGAEAAVVRGLLDSPVRPSVCVVAGVAPGIGPAAGDEAVALLAEAGYVHCLFDGLHHYLTLDPALQPALSAPANPRDDFVPVALVRLEEERDNLNATIATLIAENEALSGITASGAGAGQDELAARVATGAIRPEPSAQDEPALADEGDRPRSGPGIPVVEVAASTLVGSWQYHSPEPALRAARRRATFGMLLRAVPPPQLPDPATDDSSIHLLALSRKGLSPVTAISVLYQEILGRAADPEDVAVWSGRLESGVPLLDLARELASSAEALGRAPEDRARTQSELRSWESLVAASELGVAAWRLARTYTPGSVAHEIFVGALFEVALQRLPSVDEVRSEVAKLSGGLGRERLLRDFAARPDVRERFLGKPDRRLRGRLLHLRDGRHHVETFRALVTAAEARQVAEILAAVVLPGSSLPDLARGPSISSGEQ